MSCARQSLGMPDNCALCREHQPDLYKPCHGEPDKVKLSIKKHEPEIVVVSIKELSYDETKKQVMNYIKTKGGRVSISEIVEKLRLDIGLVSKIIEDG